MPLSLRDATQADRQRLANLIHFEVYVHRHLDWRPALDWLGHKPYLVAEAQEEIIGTLACPLDEPEIAWIRLFAARSDQSLKDVWQALWVAAWAELSESGHKRTAAIAMQGWFRLLLEESGFEHTDNIVVLLWEQGNKPLPAPNTSFSIRAMVPEDLERVYRLDSLAFEYEWRNSANALALAYQQSTAAMVIEDGGTLIGYQISTTSMAGGHLARLAVHPEARNQGIGYALIYRLLQELQQRGIGQVTVNTQEDNIASLALYARAGFRQIEEQYQVYQYFQD
jgi:ribosomal-protein-alanine N-acetyltransferase